MNPSNPSPSRRLGPLLARIVLGLAFTVFGLNAFLNFMPPPPPKDMPAGVAAFMGAMMQTHYFLQMVGATQVISGVLLLLNRFVPLALAFLAPVIVNIILFHLFLQISTIAPGVVVLVLELYLAYSYRACFRPMLVAQASPS
jgi:uncharacterized membrane protein YphA (DoxX/SURF4 family)